MSTSIVKVPDSLTNGLLKSFEAGPIGSNGSHELMLEMMVAVHNGMRIDIYANEHPPPHFHVIYGNENASFSVTDCSRLPGVEGLKRYDRNIRKWYLQNRCELIEFWNRSRPTDCRVGAVDLPPECL